MATSASRQRLSPLVASDEKRVSNRFAALASLIEEPEGENDERKRISAVRRVSTDTRQWVLQPRHVRVGGGIVSLDSDILVDDGAESSVFGSIRPLQGVEMLEQARFCGMSGLTETGVGFNATRFPVRLEDRQHFALPIFEGILSGSAEVNVYAPHDFHAAGGVSVISSAGRILIAPDGGVIPTVRRGKTHWLEAGPNASADPLLANMVLEQLMKLPGIAERTDQLRAWNAPAASLPAVQESTPPSPITSVTESDIEVVPATPVPTPEELEATAHRTVLTLGRPLEASLWGRPAVCGHGFAPTLHTARHVGGRNDGRQYVRCPLSRGEQCGYFRWVSEAPPVADSGSDSEQRVVNSLIARPAAPEKGTSNKASEAASSGNADEVPLTFTINKRGRFELQLGDVEVAHIELDGSDGPALVFHNRKGQESAVTKDKASSLAHAFLSAGIEEARVSDMARVVQQHKREAAAADPARKLPEKPLVPNANIARLLMAAIHAFGDSTVRAAYRASPKKPVSAPAGPSSGGRLDMELVLDTGSNETLLDRDFVSQAGIELDKSTRFDIVVANGPTFTTEGRTKTPVPSQIIDVDGATGTLAFSGQSATLSHEGGSARKALIDVMGTVVSRLGFIVVLMKNKNGGGRSFYDQPRVEPRLPDRLECRSAPHHPPSWRIVGSPLLSGFAVGGGEAVLECRLGSRQAAESKIVSS